MKTRRLGNLEVSAIGMGCMGFTHAYGTCPDEQEGIRLVHKAFELGCNFFDTAEMYSYFGNEEFVGNDAFAEKQGVILLTGGVAAVSPFPGYTCLAIDKAALRGLTLAMHNELAPKGIFVGTVMVCGVIGGTEHFAPANFAETYWQMYQNRKDWEVRYE